jgi:hypothetical protein
MNRFLLCLSLLLLGACEQGGAGVKGATGDTPVRYVICGVAESNCSVAARFKDLDTCESHRRWASMLCDSKSRPGEMVCRTDPGPSIGVAHCTY